MLHNISLETVRIWSEEFARHLSPIANPGKNKHRAFTENDMAVFDLVADLKSEGLTFTDIHAALEAGQLGKSPSLPPEEIQTMVISEQEKRLALQVEYLQRTLAQVQQQRDDALEQLRLNQEVEKENIRLQVTVTSLEERVTELKHQLTAEQQEAQRRIQELSSELSKLQREIGESYARGILDTLKKRGDIPD